MLCRGNANRYGKLLNQSVYCWPVMINPPSGRRRCRRTQRVMRNGNIDRRTLLRLLAGTAGAAAMSIAPEAFAQQRAKAPPKPRLVVLDPGHGGAAHGATRRTATHA